MANFPSFEDPLKVETKKKKRDGVIVADTIGPKTAPPPDVPGKGPTPVITPPVAGPPPVTLPPEDQALPFSDVEGANDRAPPGEREPPPFYEPPVIDDSLPFSDVGGGKTDPDYGTPVGPPDDIEALSDDFNAGYLGAETADTSDEEAYVNQRILDQLGADQVGARARMGRAGFGASGALEALEGDQMRQANLDAEGRIYDVREREQNQRFEQGMGAQGADIDRTQAESELEQAKAQGDAIRAMLDKGSDADGDSVPDDLNDPQARIENTQGHTTADLGPGGDDTPGSPDTPYVTTTGEKTKLERAGYVFTAAGQTVFGEPIFVDQDGNHWFIRGQT